MCLVYLRACEKPFLNVVEGVCPRIGRNQKTRNPRILWRAGAQMPCEELSASCAQVPAPQPVQRTGLGQGGSVLGWCCATVPEPAF